MWWTPTTTTMTFRELTETVNPYPDDFNDDALKATISAWFDARNVCDDNMFVTFFRRLLAKDYDRYLQLLRIEAGIAQYDWLVQQYHEHKIDVTRTPDLTTATQNNTTTSGGTTHDGDTTDINSGVDTKAKSGTDTHTADYTDTLTHDTQSKAITGNEPTNETTVTRPTRNVKTGYAENTSNDYYSGSDTVTLEKDNPMSNSYQSGVTFYGQTQGDGVSLNTKPTTDLNWATMSRQEETGDATRTHTDTKRLENDNYTNQQETYSGNEVTTRKDSGGTEKTGTETREIEGERDKATYASQDATTYGHQIKHEYNDGTTSHSTVNGTASQVTTGTDSTVTKDRFAGRSDDPATILKRAVSFITNTSAWEWLYKELDQCFITIIDL